jgi:hypothetical protein
LERWVPEILRYGNVGSFFEQKGVAMSFRLKFAIVGAALAFSAAVQAMPEIPVESAKALGRTRGKMIKTGLVFVDGKYMEPPYVVERWGTGIRINNAQVTGQIIDWIEFLKTQEGFKVKQSEPAADAASDGRASSTESQTSTDEGSSSLDDLFEDDSKDVGESSLDDLFDDDPKPAKKKKSVSRKPPKPKAQFSYEFAGEFSANEASKALLQKINALRTDIDKHLRNGGFICFGENYSRVMGDSRTSLRMLERLPDLMRKNEDLKSFTAEVRAAGMIYFPDELYRDLFSNRLDYRKLDKRCKKWKKDLEWEKVLKETGTPLF